MTNTISAIIIDDDDFSITALSDTLNSLYNNIEISGIYKSWNDGLDALRVIKADILFLDITINGKNGMDLLKMVPASDMEIIFVTAHTEYALEAFKLAATGYIIKPVGDKELSIAVDKAIERISNKKTARLNLSIPVQLANSKIGIPNSKGINYYDMNDIIYLEATSNYTRVVTKQHEVLSSNNMSKFTHLLEGSTFCSVHRSYIVNLNCVSRYEAPGTIIMNNKIEIPLSRTAREDFLKRFNSIQAKTE